MEVGGIREETCTEEETACEKINASVVEQELETAILEYAISTFPFSSAFENVPGYREEELPEALLRGNQERSQRHLRKGMY